MDIQWPLVFFTLLTGVGVGAFAFVAITEWLGKAERIRLPVAITALAAVVLGGIASLFHLGHVERIFNALLNFGSGIFLEMVLMMLVGLVILIYIIMLWKGSSTGARKFVATIGLLLAIILSYMMGESYVLPARPAWNTFLLPLIYVISAAVLGLFSVYVWAVSKEEKNTAMGVNKAALIALAIQAIIFIGFMIFLAMAPHSEPSRSPSRLLAGDMSIAFWLGIVLIGLVIPLLMTAFQATKKMLTPFIVATVGLICVLLGGIAFRAIMYVIGSSIEKFL